MKTWLYQRRVSLWNMALLYTLYTIGKPSSIAALSCMAASIDIALLAGIAAADDPALNAYNTAG